MPMPGMEGSIGKPISRPFGFVAFTDTRTSPPFQETLQYSSYPGLCICRPFYDVDP